MVSGTLEQEVMKQLKALLEGGQAHAKLEEAAADFPPDLQGSVPEGLPYSAWQLLEHIRIAQRDILEFSDNADGSYQPMMWPDEYWPRNAAPPDRTAWEKSIAALQADRAAFEQLLETRDLFQPFPWGEGQNLLREALLIADHAAYHTGEIIMLRRLLGAWKPTPGHA